ncbi:MAG: dihydroorotase [Clostridia bacterium]|nr:dihydroorotase [Clostridia bacterium]
MEILKVKELNSTNPSLYKAISSFTDSIDNYVILPGFCDVHVHFREPGFEYKETISSGVESAINGGYTTVFTMPNLKPVPDSLENLNIQLEAIKKVGKIEVMPYGSITVNQMGEELADLDATSPYVCAFSDDGRGVQSTELMEKAMLKAKSLNKIIVAHCEDNSLLFGGYIHDGEYAKLNGHKGISSESEWKQIERDIKLVKKIGVKYHVCHISTKESVDLIRKAKSEGVDITCETAPHYLIFSDLDLSDDGKYKMNPPIRGESDRLKLIEGLKDGTIDMIATDHAPHSIEEKSKGLKGSLNGIVGLETAFPVLYTHLVKKGVITLEKLVELMSINPKKRFNVQSENDYCIWDLDSVYKINVKNFKSKGKSSPFEDMKVYGKRILTIKDNKIVG